MAHLPPEKLTPPIAHPGSVIILVIGLAVLAVGIVRMQIGQMTVPARSVATEAHAPRREPGPLRIVATLPPLMWVVKGLAPEGTEFTSLSPPGSGCEGIELTPMQVAAVRRADVVVRIGFGLDDAVVRAASSAAAPRQLVLSFEDILDRDSLISAAPQPGHEGHSHSQFNPHVWLDPGFMEQLIDRCSWLIAEADETARSDSPSANRLPERLEFRRLGIEENAMRLSGTCRLIDAEYRRRLGDSPTRAIVTQHDAFAYLARRYGLEIAAVIQQAHGVEPSPGDIARVAGVIRERGIRAVFIEPQINPGAANRIAETTGARVLMLDPIGDGDWPTMMRRNLEALVAGLGTE